MVTTRSGKSTVTTKTNSHSLFRHARKSNRAPIAKIRWKFFKSSSHFFPQARHKLFSRCDLRHFTPWPDLARGFGRALAHSCNMSTSISRGIEARALSVRYYKSLPCPPCYGR